MLNLTEIATSTEERVLTGVKAGQALAIDGLRSALSVADRVIPSQVSDRVEARITALPDATPVVEGAFGFASKLLNAQREFVGEVVNIVQPEPANAAAATKTATKAKSTAKKTATKAKSTAKKTASKAKKAA